MSIRYSGAMRRWALSPLAMAVALVGCGDDSQDRGARAAEPTPMAGLVIDGYMARARVYLDQDGNGLQDPWEPSALTDEDGYFSRNDRSGVDYCAEQETLHCLRIRAGDKGVLRAVGGYDELTGEPSTAELSASLPRQGNALLTPFTTLIAESGVDATDLLLQLGLNEADLGVDYLASDDTELTARAIGLHKIVSVLGAELQGRYTQLGEDVKLPSSASGAVYRALGQALQTTSVSLPEMLADRASLVNVSRAAQRELSRRYQSAELQPPVEVESASAALGGDMVALTHHLFGAPNLDSRAAARALEVVVQQAALRGAASAGTAARYLREGPPATVAALLEGLGSSRADLPALARLDFGGEPFVDPAAARERAQLPASAEPFKELAGYTLRVQDLFMGHAPNDLRDIELEAYFAAGNRPDQGSFTACVKYIEEARSDGKLGEGNTRGERVQGRWQLLNPSDGTSYNLLLSIRFLGTDYQAIMKPAGDAVSNGVSYKALRFDYAGEIRTWYSPTGLTPTDSVPVSNADCRARLPSRVGL